MGNEKGEQAGVMYLRVEKPLLACSEAEFKERIELIESTVAEGKTVILGFERCCFCGRELGEPTGKMIKDGSGPPKLILNLCGDCLF